MPRYELALILKAMQRPETAAVLKRTVEALMERGAIVRNLENLGERSLPYKISKHKERHRRGGLFKSRCGNEWDRYKKSKLSLISFGIF
ncbi:small ribosomal subunit protein bS6m isoform 2-T2 [Cariama cristata]